MQVDRRLSKGDIVSKWIQTASQRCTLTILKIIGLGLAPHVQLLAAGLGVPGNVIVVHYDPFGSRNQPLIRSGVSILLLKSTELVV